jgi:HK97 family phage prohead protease
MSKRALRGLYVIRGGSAGAALKMHSGGVIPAEEWRAKNEKDEPIDDGRLATLEVNFSTFNTWYRIDSFWEGTFLERTVPGSFKKTIAERGQQVKILYNHGMDMNIGDKVLAVPEVIEERKESPYLEGGLLDTSYNRDLLPGLRAGAYGSSFMFEVLHDEWNEEPERSADNPDGIPERTIHEVRLFEAGPVTWPANPDATAGVRSGVDWYGEQIQRRDPARHEDLVRSFAAFRALNGLHVPTGTPATVSPDAPVPPAPEGRHVTGLSAAARQRRLKLMTLGQ